MKQTDFTKRNLVGVSTVRKWNTGFVIQECALYGKLHFSDEEVNTRGGSSKQGRLLRRKNPLKFLNVKTYWYWNNVETLYWKADVLALLEMSWIEKASKATPLVETIKLAYATWRRTRHQYVEKVVHHRMLVITSTFTSKMHLRAICAISK